MSNHFVPNQLRTHRKRAGLRQFDVARTLGLHSTDRISRWEKGSAVPHMINLFKLAALYKTLPHELYPEVFKVVSEYQAVDIPSSVAEAASSPQVLLLDEGRTDHP